MKFLMLLCSLQKVERTREVELSKREHWGKLTTDIWKAGYKIASKEISNKETTDLKSLLPDGERVSEYIEESEEVEPITRIELEAAAEERHQGLDLITTEMVKIAVMETSEILLEMSNKLLKHRKFLNR